MISANGLDGSSAVVWSSDAWLYETNDLQLVLPTAPIYNDNVLLGSDLAPMVAALTPDLIVTEGHARSAWPSINGVLSADYQEMDHSDDGNEIVWVRDDLVASLPALRPLDRRNRGQAADRIGGRRRRLVAVDVGDRGLDHHLRPGGYGAGNDQGHLTGVRVVAGRSEQGDRSALVAFQPDRGGVDVRPVQIGVKGHRDHALGGLAPGLGGVTLTLSTDGPWVGECSGGSE